jgi:DNA-binding response OmpR family regulator
MDEPLKVLVVEDDPQVAGEMCERLDSLGYAFLGPAATLDDAARIIAQHAPDVAVLDGTLAGRSSVPLAVKLAAQGTPVVFCTGADFIKNLPPELAKAPVLTKPISNALLAAALRSVLA